jgi:hypothetical protein
VKFGAVIKPAGLDGLANRLALDVLLVQVLKRRDDRLV